MTESRSIDEILVDRGSRYGTFKGHAELTQNLKESFSLYAVNYTKLTPSMTEALDMVFHKLGRIGNGDPTYIESWRDCIGYLQLVVSELQTTEGATDGRVVSMKVVDGVLKDAESNKMFTTKWAHFTIEVDTADKYLLDNYFRVAVKEGKPTGVLVTVAGKELYLHRLVLNVTGAAVVDHVDGNPLNNLRANLRIVSYLENARNRVKPKSKTNDLPKGVTFAKKQRLKQYKAAIKVYGCNFHLGSFETVKEAEDAYLKAANMFFGKHALHNSRNK
jgi:hypothetical protein